MLFYLLSIEHFPYTQFLNRTAHSHEIRVRNIAYNTLTPDLTSSFSAGLHCVSGVAVVHGYLFSCSVLSLLC
jgi:hypothetical protein